MTQFPRFCWLQLVAVVLLVGCSSDPTFFADDEVDVDGDGILPRDGDCDDRTATVHSQHPEYCDGIDNDCDGLVDGEDDDLGDRDGDGADACSDCDDEDPSRSPGLTEICDGQDNDCDGSLPDYERDEDQDGVPVCAGDCDDNDNQVGPGLPEICDGRDSDCDGLSESIDPDVIDQDGDQFRACDDCDDDNPSVFPGADELCDGLDNGCLGEIAAIELDGDEDGFTPCEGDCDDFSALIYPGAAELCNGIDDSCQGSLTTAESDADGDGQSLCEGDCDDGDASVHSAAVEQCNGADDDCLGGPGADELDADGDEQRICEGDCNDFEAGIFLGAVELCNGIDDDCSAGVPSSEVDSDGDGVRLCAGDCDDSAATVSPGASELCDGIDNDCDGNLPADEADWDGDGVRVCQGDCDDSLVGVFPGAAESCNGIDDDCINGVPQDEQDLDGDGVGACAGDCDDGDPLRFPGNAEACSGIDEDCDNLVDGLDPDIADADADGASACTDCDDSNAAVAPELLEVCGDGLDNDCDALIDEPNPEVGLQLLATGRADGALNQWTINPLGGIGLPTALGSGLGNTSLAVASADFDGDGVVEVLRQDLGAASGSGAVDRVGRVCDGTTGELSVPGIVLSADEYIMASSDLDADGDVDLISVQFSGANQGLVRAHMNDGVGAFAGPDPDLVLVTPGLGTSASRWSLGRTPVDHTGDGFADLVECSWTPAANSLCLLHPGRGNGTFSAGTIVVIMQAPVEAVVQGDFDNDGAGDLLLGLSGSGDSGQLYYLSGRGDGSFVLPSTSIDINTVVEGGSVGAAGRGMAIPMRIDGDSNLDLVLLWDTGVGSSQRALATALGNGSGGFVLGPVLAFVSESPFPQSREWLAVPLP